MAVSLSSLYGSGAQLFDNKGVVLSGGKINTYLAGSLTPATTWSDPLGAVPNSNPIVLDSAGRTTVQIYITNSTGYKFIVTDANGSSIGVPWDNIFSVGTGGGGGSTSIWTETGLTPTFVSSTSFTVTGNQTALFPIGTRVKTLNTGGTAYSTVISSTFSSVTTVTLFNDSLPLDSGLSDVATSFVPQNSIVSSGTFTPTLKSGGVAQATNFHQGRYILVDNCVTFALRVSSSSAMPGIAAATVGGLPFAPTTNCAFSFSTIYFNSSPPITLTAACSYTGEGFGSDIVLAYVAGNANSGAIVFAPKDSTQTLDVFITGSYFIS